MIQLHARPTIFKCSGRRIRMPNHVRVFAKKLIVPETAYVYKVVIDISDNALEALS